VLKALGLGEKPVPSDEEELPGLIDNMLFRRLLCLVTQPVHFLVILAYATKLTRTNHVSVNRKVIF
jgi:hypothetical protein